MLYELIEHTEDYDMNNTPVLSIDISPKGITAIRLMAYSDDIERKADKTYRLIKKHLIKIDKALSKENNPEIRM